MPDRLLSMLCLLSASAGVAAALEVEGATSAGMAFRGTVVSASGGVLMLARGDHAATQQVGLPFVSIRSLRPVAAAADDADFLGQMESAAALLPLWQPEIIGRICGILEAATAAGDWARIYQWTQRLAALSLPGPRAEQLQLLRAWCLLEMGLRRPADECLRQLLEQTDPLLAPPRLCWLAARLALENGDLEAARHWAQLPALRIPAAAGPVAAELAALVGLIEMSNSRAEGPTPYAHPDHTHR